MTPSRRLRASLAMLLVTGLAGACSSEVASQATDSVLHADGSGDAAPKCQTSAAGATCDDGNACTAGDQCGGGQCAGTAVDCSDGATCTVDSCNKATGCSHVTDAGLCAVPGNAEDGKPLTVCVAAGAVQPANPCRTCQPGVDAEAWSADIKPTCDDGDGCTSDDACQSDGTCKGKALVCDDKNPCTLDACQPGVGCASTPVPAGVATACVDDNPCTIADVCQDGICHGGTGKLQCDDGSPCTKDACIAKKGCSSVDDAKACDDGKPCTLDTCDAKTGCSHKDLKPGDTCADGDFCVVGKTCSATLECTGGAAKNCDDGNVCTTESCKPSKGCVHALNKLECDDGFDCTMPDLCTGGTCIGVKSSWCKKCQKFFSPTEGKLTTFQIGSGGKIGQGIDVDGDPKTCAPSADCSDGIDNAAAVLALFVNKPLIAAVQDGTMTFVVEFDGWQAEGVPFTLNIYQAALSPAAKAAGCNGQADVCEWVISQQAMSANCLPKFSFPDAKVVGGKLTAGGAGTLFAMDADLIGAKNTTLYVKGARIEADVKFAADGKTLVSANGVLGGAVPQQTVLDVINSLDDSTFAQFGQTKKGVLDLINMILELDVDIDGDGTGDAASIGLRFSAVGAKVAGFPE